MIFILIILFLSLVLNIFFIKYDILPYLIPSVRRRINKSNKKDRDIFELEGLILSASLSTIKRKKAIMYWNYGGSYSKIVSTVSSILNKTSNKDFRNYNYPRGYLLSGLSEYLISTRDTENLLVLKSVFDKYYVAENGKPLFNLDKVDQSPFGVTSINLYKVYKEEKYLLFAKEIYSLILKNYLDDNLVIYRDNSKNELNDTIGMIVPFLVKYYQLTGEKKAESIANTQIHFFIQNGTDLRTFMPSHGVNLKTKIMVGSANWGRGIGWYFIGLKESYDLNGNFKKEYEGLSRTINSLQNKEGLWGQFPGSNDVFDASSSTMFFYCLPKEEYKLEEILSKLDKYISKDGFILQTTGDTEGLNSYSVFSSKSELSQGVLLMILNKYK